MANAKLHQAKQNKKDEFYTQMEDIARELYHYRHHFRDKSVFLNCDDPEESNFWKYFELNFDDLGLTRLVSTHYHPAERTYKLVMERNEEGDITTTKTPLEGNGDFRSAECIALLDEADIITTNPPFSLFREYLALLMEHKKKFLIIGNQNAITYKEVFPFIKNNEMWLGYGFPGNVAFFKSPYEDTAVSSQHKEGLIRVSGVMWFTNLDIDKRHAPLTLWRDYTPEDYPRYDNYDAIEVSKVAEIPVDYYGVMGVPITFMDKYCPEQFEILGCTANPESNSVEKRPRSDKAVSLIKQGRLKGAKCVGGNSNIYIDDDDYVHVIYHRLLIRRVDQPDTQDGDE